MRSRVFWRGGRAAKQRARAAWKAWRYCDLIAETVLSFVHGIALCQRLADEPEQLERRFDYLKRLFMLAVFQAATTSGGNQ